MNFKEFVELTRPVIGGKGGIQKYVRTLFDAILTEDGSDILEDYSDSSFKSYGNGNVQITEIAKAMSPHLDLVEFATFIFQAGESAQLQLCERFSPCIPNINACNVGDEIASLFADIIWEAAGTKRKSAPKDAQENTGTPPHGIISEKIFASGKAVADTWDQVIQAKADDMSKTESTESKATDAATAEQMKDNKQPVLNVGALSDDDKKLLKVFRNDCKEIMLYVIDNDPAAGPTAIWLSDTINEIVQKWQLRYREAEDRVLRNLAADILKTLSEYTYYISDVFLRYIPERNVLWFRNESWEEGNRLRDVLQPKSYELRCKIAKLYEALYPIPVDEQDDTETVEAEVVDGEEPSGAAHDDKKTTVIQQQINVIQNGEKNFNLTNNGTMNFNF